MNPSKNDCDNEESVIHEVITTGVAAYLEGEDVKSPAGAAYLSGEAWDRIYLASTSGAGQSGCFPFLSRSGAFFDQTVCSWVKMVSGCRVHKEVVSKVAAVVSLLTEVWLPACRPLKPLQGKLLQRRTSGL